MKIKPLSVTLTLISALLFAFSAMADSRYIHVSGEGQVEVWPDFLTIQLMLRAEDTTVSAAKEKVDMAMNSLLTITQTLTIAKQDIEAAKLSNQPLYDWVDNKRKLRAEQVSRQVSITLRQLEQYSTLLHQLLQLPNVQIQRSQSGFDDAAAHSLQATNLALQQAKQKAESMASTLGVRLGKVLSIEEQNQPFTPLRTEARLFNVSADSPSTEPAPMLLQKQNINGRVQVRFEIK